ncbi:YraN family protein [Patescibacteria group bacterium]
MAEDPRKKFGNFGEELAASFLKNRGYKIVEKNFVVKNLGEIDIVCKKGNKIIFVEVKTRSGNFFGSPEESITPRKRRKLSQLAHSYLDIKKWHYKEFAIDGVFIETKDEKYKIRHLENIVDESN